MQEIKSQVCGSIQIIRQITPVSYCVAFPPNYRISPTFHVSLLKPAGGPRGERDQEEAPSNHCGWRGGVPGAGNPGLPTPGQVTTISH